MVPLRELRAYAAALPRVLARESMRLAQAIAVGTGSIRTEDRRAVLSDWERASSAGQPVLRATTREGHEAVTASMGIGVKLVPRETN